VDYEARIAWLEAELLKRDAIIAELREQNSKLARQVAELLERLNQNSGNSHLPPSSDGPGGRPSKKFSKKKIWFQKT
jgi:uncharacterized coiled-coil protein SlyX